MEIIPKEVGGKLSAYNEFRAQLAVLKAENQNLVFDYEEPSGNKEARSHVFKLRKSKTAVDNKRKEEKAASLDYGRRVDSEAKEIVSEIEAMIEVHDKPLREIAQREKDRIERIESILDETARLGVEALTGWINFLPGGLEDRLIQMKQLTVDDTFGEFAPEMEKVHAKAIADTETAIARRKKHDEEQAELNRLKKEAAEREQKDRDDRIRKEAEENERKRLAEEQAKKDAEAERQAKAEQDRVHRMAEELERREKAAIAEKEAAERRALEAEEREKKAAELATLREQERRRQEEVAARAAEEKRQSSARHRAKIKVEAVSFIRGIHGTTDEQADGIFEAIASGAVPHCEVKW